VIFVPELKAKQTIRNFLNSCMQANCSDDINLVTLYTIQQSSLIAQNFYQINL